MQEVRTSVNKTSLKSVWQGTEAQLQKIKSLAEANSRLMMHASHFVKFHSVSNLYFGYDDTDCAAIFALLNNSNTTRRNSDKFRNSILEYMNLVHYEGENLDYFTNFALYQGTDLKTQILIMSRSILSKKSKITALS
jgi:hypothetical protein